MLKHQHKADVQGQIKIERPEEEIKEGPGLNDTKSRHSDVRSEINLKFFFSVFLLCLLLLSLAPIFWGDLSFPVDPMLISYWSSRLRVGVYEMGKRGNMGR